MWRLPTRAKHTDPVSQWTGTFVNAPLDGRVLPATPAVCITRAVDRPRGGGGGWNCHFGVVRLENDLGTNERFWKSFKVTIKDICSNVPCWQCPCCSTLLFVLRFNVLYDPTPCSVFLRKNPDMLSLGRQGQMSGTHLRSVLLVIGKLFRPRPGRLQHPSGWAKRECYQGGRTWRPEPPAPPCFGQ